MCKTKKRKSAWNYFNELKTDLNQNASLSVNDVSLKTRMNIAFISTIHGQTPRND